MKIKLAPRIGSTGWQKEMIKALNCPNYHFTPSEACKKNTFALDNKGRSIRRTALETSLIRTAQNLVLSLSTTEEA